MATEKYLPTKRRRLFFDIETSPNIGLFWQAGYKKNIDSANIITERAIICICYKWEDDKEIHYLNWTKKHCDKQLLINFIKVANQADEMIGHNGDRFDLPWIRTRCLYHQIDMFPKYVTIDTLKWSRSKFKFNSNKLNYIAKYLGIGQKNVTDFDLWKDIILHNDAKAMKKMIDYCKNDVLLLEKVYKKLSIHFDNKTHFGVIFGKDKHSCNECGSDQLIRSRNYVSATGVKKIQYQCKTCHKFCTKIDK